MVGRRFFWLSLACIGFLAAFRVTLQSGGSGPAWIAWAVPVCVGLLGALVALVFQKVAVILIGFMTGEMLTMDLVFLLGMESGRFAWVLLLAGGLAGAIAVLVLFDWALIVMSSLIGASVIITVSGLGRPGGDILFAGLAILGVTFQGISFIKTRGRNNA